MAVVRAVSFDFDNTLLLSEACKHETMRQVCARFPHALDVLATVPTDSRTAPPGVTVTRHTIFTAVAHGLLDRGALPEGVSDAVSFGKQLCEEFSQLLEQRLLQAKEVPGATDLLATLCKHGVAVYINTATPQEPIDQLVDALGWRKYFRGVFGHPGTKVTNLQRVGEAEGVANIGEELLHVGDGNNDCKAAAEVGCRFVGVRLAPELGGAPRGASHPFTYPCVDVVADMNGALHALCPLLGIEAGRPPSQRHACRTCDLGFALAEGSVSWPTCKPLCREILKAPESTAPPGARSKQAFTLNGGTGTHMDAPAHFIPGGRTIDQLLGAELVNVPLAVVDCAAPPAAAAKKGCGDGKRLRDGSAADRGDGARSTSSSADVAERLLSVEDIFADEARHGMIPPGALVCVRTGWAVARYESREAYYNAPDPADVDPYLGMPRMRFPGISEAAAHFLVTNRQAVGVGIDTLSPDGGSGAGRGFPAHHAILGRDRYIVENMRLEEDVPNRGAVATVAPLNIVGAPETPTRVWAVLPDTSE